MNTMQQEFDAVVAHLYAQGRPSKSGWTCLYRGPNGTSCAVGCRIPDEVYMEDMDYGDYGSGTAVNDLLGAFRDVLPPEIKEYEDMFSRLQFVHDADMNSDIDGAFIFERLETGLAGIAAEFGLTFTVPQ